MEYYVYTSKGELYHHGVKGMKWGQRLYQNKDGSLTALGKKRRANLEGKISKLEAKNKKLGGKKGESESKSEAPHKKSVSEMTNKELQEHTTRMTLEKNYYDAEKNLANAVPAKQVSKGRKYAEKFLNDSVLPAISNTAKSYLENYLKKTLGLDTKDTLGELKKTYDILDYQQRIDKIKNPDKYMNYDERSKKFKLEEDKRKSSDEYKELVEAKNERDKLRKELEEERKKRTEQGGS